LEDQAKKVVKGVAHIANSAISTVKGDTSFIADRVAICTSCEFVVPVSEKESKMRCGVCSCPIGDVDSFGLVVGKANKCPKAKW